jgi:eukaryotic-like serine/threonine-protein kinase
MADSDALIGQTISHYRIIEKLGGGGMGVVYKAEDVRLQRTVALKFLPEDFSTNRTERDNLLREARAASALDHPNIGVIYGLEDDGNGRCFISMGYYEGEALSERLARGTPSVREALDLAIQIASGLAAAHAQNIVHRDIKPGNIILAKNNQAKIVDFGLARVMAATNATLTANTSGTLPYMSPEQILGEPVDPRADAASGGGRRICAGGLRIVFEGAGIHAKVRQTGESGSGDFGARWCGGGGPAICAGICVVGLAN